MKRMHSWDKELGTFVNVQILYKQVRDNPKANARIKKKAQDILNEAGSRNGWSLVRAVKDGSITFEKWYAHHSYRTKRNIPIYKRRNFHNGLKGAYHKYIGWVEMHYAD